MCVCGGDSGVGRGAVGWGESDNGERALGTLVIGAQRTWAGRWLKMKLEEDVCGDQASLWARLCVWSLSQEHKNEGKLLKHLGRGDLIHLHFKVINYQTLKLKKKC